MNRTIQQIIITTFFPALLLAACGGKRSQVELPGEMARSETFEGVAEQTMGQAAVPADDEKPVVKSPTALRFDSIGLVDVSELDSCIIVSLLYATPDNFTGEVLYGDLKEAYLHPDAAESLLKAQRLLKQKHPEYTLIIYDATRPMSAQRKMWDLVKGTSKSIYVSNPARGGGLHNYGLAVDISIFNTHTGTPLPMGTEVDHLGYEAHITDEVQFVKKGIITQQEKENRELLRSVMRGAGFRALHSEWWHFNRYGREEAKKKYTLVE